MPPPSRRRRRAPLPGEALDVSRIEHDNLSDAVLQNQQHLRSLEKDVADAVLDNQRRFERLEKQLQQLGHQLAEISDLLQHLRSRR